MPGALISDSQFEGENHSNAAIGTGLAGHDCYELHSTSASEAAIIQIVQLWRMRQRWHRAEKSLILQGKAICRSEKSWIRRMRGAIRFRWQRSERSGRGLSIEETHRRRAAPVSFQQFPQGKGRGQRRRSTHGCNAAPQH
jgi:ribosomal protein L13E